MKISLRHSEIMQLLTDEGTISIADLAARLAISQETIRRDVQPLAREGKLVRLHGAVSLPSIISEAPFERRMRDHMEAKKAIARLAAASIGDGESLMLDTGTTTSYLARELLDHRRLTVVTNSSDIARTLATVNGNSVYMVGGKLRSDSGAALGAPATDFIRRFNVDHAIISAGAIDAENGIMDYDLEEADFARVVISRGKRVLVVSDASKFGRKGLVKVCGLDEIDELVSDSAPPADLAERLAQAEVKVTLAKSD